MGNTQSAELADSVFPVMENPLEVQKQMNIVTEFAASMGTTDTLLPPPGGTKRSRGSASLVSVVMPNLNNGNFIEGAIKSVLSQSYRNIELLVIDNGSIDQSVSIAEHLAREDERVSLFDEPRRGVSHAINAGLKKAAGDLVTIIASDDVYAEDKTRKQVECLLDDEPSISYTGGWYMDELGRPYDMPRPWARDGQKEPIRYDGMIFHELINRTFWNDVFSASFMYPKKCLEGREFDTSLVYGEDWDFHVRLSRSYPYRYIPEPLYGYRIHPGNTWAKGNEQRNLRNKIRIFEGWLRDFDNLTKEDRGTIMAQLFQATEELEGSIGMIDVAIRHPRMAKMAWNRATASVRYRTRTLVPYRIRKALH